MNLLTWRVVLRGAAQGSAAALPPAILTTGAPFFDERLPLEVALLLPNTAGAAGLIAAVPRAPHLPPGCALGLFLADPFLNVSGEVGCLKAAGIAVVANLPSVEQQDLDFVQQLGDVGLDFAREADRLGEFRRAGFGVIAVVAGAAAARAVRPLEPLAVVVLPRVADYAAGFPSFRRRGAVAREVAAALTAEGWQGPLLGLAAASEVAHQTLWPDVLDGVLCRPEPLNLPPASP